MDSMDLIIYTTDPSVSAVKSYRVGPEFRSTYQTIKLAKLHRTTPTPTGCHQSVVTKIREIIWPGFVVAIVQRLYVLNLLSPNPVQMGLIMLGTRVCRSRQCKELAAPSANGPSFLPSTSFSSTFPSSCLSRFTLRQTRTTLPAARRYNSIAYPNSPAKFIAGLMAACSLVGSGICPPNLDLPNVQQAWRPLINSFFKHTIV
ncbi:hypothetical protein FPQ18DRAFT_308148 [Pyronema domesticum]|nr:hypothetical protein FPQ18DRAFT_308148 [Pyronema domesticum]